MERKEGKTFYGVAGGKESVHYLVLISRSNPLKSHISFSPFFDFCLFITPLPPPPPCNIRLSLSLPHPLFFTGILLHSVTLCLLHPHTYIQYSLSLSLSQ